RWRGRLHSARRRRPVFHGLDSMHFRERARLCSASLHPARPVVRRRAAGLRGDADLRLLAAQRLSATQRTGWGLLCQREQRAGALSVGLKYERLWRSPMRAANPLRTIATAAALATVLIVALAGCGSVSDAGPGADGAAGAGRGGTTGAGG